MIRLLFTHAINYISSRSLYSIWTRTSGVTLVLCVRLYPSFRLRLVVRRDVSDSDSRDTIDRRDSSSGPRNSGSHSGLSALPPPAVGKENDFLNQSFATHAGRPGFQNVHTRTGASLSTGIVKWNVLPCPGIDSTQILPP
jgi:hypothetical protein